MKTLPGYLLPLFFLVPASNACADTPAFDRPGIAFSTTTLAPGSFAVEQGLPDFQHSSDKGTASTLYSADTNIRVGISKNIELQLSTALFNHLSTRTSSGASESANGYGDTGLALKAALPSSLRDFSWAVLAGVTFPGGETPFSEEHARYDLGTTLNLAVNDTYSTAFYVNFSRLDDQNTYTFSPSLSVALTDRIGTYVEAGVDYADQDSATAVAGGGFTWLVTPVVQLDISADFGLNSASPDVQAGFGISAIID